MPTADQVLERLDREVADLAADVPCQTSREDHCPRPVAWKWVTCCQVTLVCQHHHDMYNREWDDLERRVLYVRCGDCGRDLTRPVPIPV